MMVPFASVVCSLPSQVPVRLLQQLQKPEGLFNCASTFLGPFSRRGSLHVTIGQNDTLWTAAVAQEIFGRLEPPAKISLVDGGHMWPVECPKACAELVAESFAWLRSRM